MRLFGGWITWGLRIVLLVCGVLSLTVLFGVTLIVVVFAVTSCAGVIPGCLCLMF